MRQFEDKLAATIEQERTRPRSFEEWLSSVRNSTSTNEASDG